MGLPGSSVLKNMPANAGETGSIPGSGRAPGEGNGNPLQYSCLGNLLEGGAWRSLESQKIQTQLSKETTTATRYFRSLILDVHLNKTSPRNYT